jgi:drug/metabolite transporter (DMT)-like permease
MIQNNWIFLAFSSMIITAMGALSLKYISESKYNDNTILAITFIIMGIFSLGYLIYDTDLSYKFILECNYQITLFILFFSLLLIINNYIMNLAFKNSPNIGYTHMIINLNIIFSLLAGYFIFKQNINIKCFVGIIIALIGISIIILNK